MRLLAGISLFLSLGLLSFVPPLSEAPAGFDGKSNGLVDDATHAADLIALDHVFTFWVTLPPRTAFRSIKQLPPGHSMTIHDGRVTVLPHWKFDLAQPLANSKPKEEQLAGDLLTLLHDAVHIRLRSDVPVGAYLSGGIDSTVITALVDARVGKRLRTFSVSFEDG